MAYTYRLEGLNCANCASKIEDKVKGLDTVQQADLNFIQSTLKIEPAADWDDQAQLKVLQNLVDATENGVTVISLNNHEDISAAGDFEGGHPHSHSHPQESKTHLYRILAAGVLFLLGFLIPFPNQLAALLYFILTYLLISYDILQKTLNNIRHGNWFDENFLMTIATIGAFGIGEYSEAVAVMLFYQVGEWFQDRAVDQSRESIADLMDIRPDFAWVNVNDRLEKKDPQKVKVGQKITVKAGEKVPLDGNIIKGASTLDTAALTGESLPQAVESGDAVVSGTINLTGLLEIEVTKIYADSTVSQIIHLVENASSKKAKTEKFITRFSRFYTPTVVFLAIALALLPPLFLSGADFSDWFYRALQFLVISCPCALVLSVPMSFYGGIGGAAKRGILVKGGNFLEVLSRLETIVFDKTGTLTQGHFAVEKVDAVNLSKSEFLEKVALVESHSNHPIARSIVEAYGQEIDNSRVSAVEEIAGKGIRALVDGREIYVGNQALMQSQGIDLVAEKDSATFVYALIDGRYAGSISIADQLKADSVQALDALKKGGIDQLVLLSGDRQAVVDEIADQTSIDQAKGQLLPQDKVREFENILKANQSSRKGYTAFVGDGINDAPVIARADVGIAMGGLGSDAAIESADVVLMNDSLTKLPLAIKIAKKTLRIANQNIWLAIGIKIIFLILAALGFTTMWEAIIADVGVTVLAVLNGLRTLRTEDIS